MEYLTKKDNLNKVVAMLPDRSFDFMIRMSSGTLGKLVGMLSFERLAGMAKVWDADMITRGMNFVVDMANHTNVFLSIYPELERRKDKGKSMTGMACFLQDHMSKFVVVCAGGGYGAVATMQEAFPVAESLYRRGFHVFVLQYRCGKNAFAPNPMDDLAQAIRLIISKEKDWKLDLSEYALMGFSAGGHLAACFGTKNVGYAKYDLPKPGVMILAYPVITMGDDTHVGSRAHLLGKKGKKDIRLQDRYSVERHILEGYPKTFVWQCDSDNTVPIQNTRLFVDALKKSNVKYRYETFSSDAHGLGLGIGTAAEGWLEHAMEFWNDIDEA